MGVVLDITINRHDEITIDPAGIHVSLLGDILFQVIQPDDMVVDAFSIKMVVDVICFQILLHDIFFTDHSVYFTS